MYIFTESFWPHNWWQWRLWRLFQIKCLYLIDFYCIFVCVPCLLQLISAAVGVSFSVISSQFPPISLILCSLVLDIILRSCGNLDPVLSNTSPCHYPVLSLIHLSSYWRSPCAGSLHARLHPWRLTGFLGFYPSLLRLSISLLSFSPSLLLSHRVRAATSSCNPALQKAVIELEIHAGIIAVIYGRR